MLQVLKDYGAAIGPTLAFALGLITLIVKQAFDNIAARKNAERRVKKIAEMVAMSPPPTYQTSQDEATWSRDTLTNIVNFAHFYDRMIAIQGAIEAADKPVHEHAHPQTIIRFQKMRRYFDFVMRERDSFKKPRAGSPIPDSDNFFNVQQCWRGLLEAAQSNEIMLEYDSSWNHASTKQTEVT